MPLNTGVIITGGASGIGAASARALAETGRPVALWDRTDPGAVAKEIAETFGVAVHPVTLDITDTDAFPDAIAQTRRALGSIGGLVHAAGSPGMYPLSAMTEELWDSVLDVNLRSHALLVRQLVDDLKAQPGSAVVAISSIAAFVGQGSLPAYCASKAGLIGLTQSMAHLLGPDGVRVNAVCPGFIDTPMLQGLPEEVLARCAAKAVFGRLGDPTEIAKAVRFLMGEEASFITGTSLVVDGGAAAVDRAT